MRFVHASEVSLSRPEAFERLRHFERIYPDLHPAHSPHAPGYAPGLLRPGYRFGLSERFGLEERRYRFEVEAYEPENGYIRLFARTRTTWGPVMVRSTLILEFALHATEAGTRVVVTQTVSLGSDWIDRMLEQPWLWGAVAAHAEAECRAAIAILGAPDFGAPAAS